MRQRLIIGAVLSLSMAGEIALAAKPAAPQPPPQQLTDLIACRGIADAEKRLACFDLTAGQLAAATDRQDIAVVDRQQVRAARRSLFGFAMPSLKIFGFGGTDKEDSDDDAKLETTLRSAREDSDGRWLLVLADGAVWRQIDATELARVPHAGSAVMIRRGALGSFVVHLDGQLGFKARRES